MCRIVGPKDLFMLLGLHGFSICGCAVLDFRVCIGSNGSGNVLGCLVQEIDFIEP